MTRQLIIGDRIISDDSDCYVIAEIGHNHQGSLKTALELFKAIKNDTPLTVAPAGSGK